MKLDASALEALSDDEIEALALDWPLWARPSQLPPAGDWVTWLLMGGRGSGKTRAGAEWVRGLAAAGTGPIALVGETITEAIAVMVRGPSGLMAVTPPDERPKLSGAALHWPNGVEGMILGAADPERFRGPQFAAAWSDEIGKWPDAEAAWDMLQFGLRLGDRPRQMATTTPRPTKLLKRLLADPHTVVTRMTTAENRKHLAQSFLGAVVARYRGTLLGRQELEGELIEDLPGALWTRDMFRPFTGGVVGRKVVAVDPPTTSGAGADACGIVLAGRVGDGAVVLADRTLQPAAPLAWARRAVALCDSAKADCIVAETNQGGEMVKAVLAQVDANVPVRMVHATRGKWLRAEPVAALYAQGRVLHAPGLTALEDEMCAFGVDGTSGGHSPDRVDALVWAVTELMLRDGPRVRGM
ncbi:MAG: ATP-binding protein [Devosia sp. 67-54]|uniref:DNA-packaging protein n=1 Tax=unclassified Devosia TaxID=196773 RepID=UPI000961CF1A|nr:MULTISPECIES: terminase family protein [unclassified Devosia]MBN9305632.1 DNA-packaging protein [Devosia sp.]OJX19199.1 MAG: ATP-binding protein [Devosia sp. 67-54]